MGSILARSTQNYAPTANRSSDNSTDPAPHGFRVGRTIVAIAVCAYKTVELVDEDGLHKRLITGDDHALAEIYDRFSRLVFGLSLRVTRDQSLAEDVTQETFLALWQSPSTFDPTQGSLRSWLCMMAHRRSVDAIRRSESHKKRIDAMASAVVVDVTIESPEKIVVDEANVNDLKTAIDALPDEQKQALWLAYFDGLTFRQVAEVLNIPEGTAKSRIRLATKRLAALLHNAGVKMEEVAQI